MQKTKIALITLKRLLIAGALVAFGPAQANADLAKIETPAGNFDFENSYPADAETSQRLYDEMDFQRATQAVLWSLPVVSNSCAATDPRKNSSTAATNSPITSLRITTDLVETVPQESYVYPIVS